MPFWLAIIGAILTGVFVWVKIVKRPEEDPLDRALNQGIASLEEGESRWFGGNWTGYRFVLTYMATSPHLLGKSARPTLKVVLACKVSKPIRASAYRRVDTQVPLNKNFEQSFDGHGLERLKEPTRIALLKFAEDFGSIWIKDREDASSALVPHGVLENTSVIIGWMVPFEDDRKRVRRALTALVNIARTLENPRKA